MLKSIFANKYIKTLLIIFILPILFMAFSYGIETLMELGRVLGNYIACL